MKTKIVFIILISIYSISFSQHTRPSTFIAKESFEFVLRDIITYINNGHFDVMNDNVKMKFDSIYSYKNFDLNKFNLNNITIPITLRNNEIEVFSKNTLDFYPSDITVKLIRKKTTDISSSPIWKIPTQHYQSNWLIRVKKITDNTTHVTISFEGVSKEMKTEIENYIKKTTNNQFQIEKFVSTKKLETILKEKINSNHKKTYFPKEIRIQN